MIKHEITELAKKKIILLDGAMGTLIQNMSLDEGKFKGERFKNSKISLKGNYDILNLTNPKIIYQIHKEYLESGADIIKTNTFNSTATSQTDYDCGSLNYELNFEGAKIAKKAVLDFKKKDKTSTKFVAGVVGPTNRTCSMSPDVNRPDFRNINFDDLQQDYYLSYQGLIEGGVDIILIETIFDTLNAKAALYAKFRLEQKIKVKIPLMVSVTIADLSGRTLSGQTLEAFYNSIIHSNPLSIGINCALGPKEIEPHLKELNRFCSPLISIHPNAGLPNAFGGYDESPDSMANYARDWAKNGLINIIGSCCGTRPEHIKVMRDALKNFKPRKVREIDFGFRLSGLSPFNMS